MVWHFFADFNPLIYGRIGYFFVRSPGPGWTGGLANSCLWQAGIDLSPVSHLAKFEKRIWWSQLPKVIFRGQAIPACRKPELVSDFGWTKSSQKSLSRWKGFYTPLVRWYHWKILKNMPAFQYFTADRVSLVSTPSSNG